VLFSYFVLKNIERRIRQSKNYEIKKYGNALRYGKFAIIYALKKIFYKYKNFVDVDELIDPLDKEVDIVLCKWKEFENYALHKKKNIKYFDVSSDFDNYYKGNTLKDDLDYFFKIKNHEGK